MALTDIKVRGHAYDLRTPDRAVVSFDLTRQGRRWKENHAAVVAAVSVLTAAIEDLIEQNPKVVADHSISQIQQSSWTDNEGQVFVESASASVEFADLDIMNQWILGQTNEITHVRNIEWKLAPQTLQAVTAHLTAQAIHDAQKRAGIFAEAAGLAIVGIQELSDPGLSQDDPTHMERAKAMMPMMDSAASNIATLKPGFLTTQIEVEAHFLAEAVGRTGFAPAQS